MYANRHLSPERAAPTSTASVFIRSLIIRAGPTIGIATTDFGIIPMTEDIERSTHHLKPRSDIKTNSSTGLSRLSFQRTLNVAKIRTFGGMVHATEGTGF